MTSIDTILRSTRQEKDLTAAELDYILSIHGPAILANAIYRAANPVPVEVHEGQARAAALRESLASQIDAAVAYAKAQSYTGWSHASTSRVQYAR